MVTRIRGGLSAVLALACGGALSLACARSLQDRAFDVLHQVPAPPAHTIEGRALSDEDYARLVAWGADWFRGVTFGGERSVTDVLGLMNGVVQAPCEAGPPGCTRDVRVFDVFVQALDGLDGVPGNLFTGNVGPKGPGYTSDLILHFPPGTRLYGTIPVPETLHTGLDVEAGEPWPLGIVPVEAPPQDQGLEYLPIPARLGAGPGSPKRVRLGLTCALCHYSLDVNGDGHADLAWARLGKNTPGSPYRPEHAWAIGNQDLHFGWLLALTTNPLVVFTVLSGPIGSSDPNDAVAFTRWILDNYARAPEAVLRQVTASVLLHPRGSADDTPDGMHQAVQMPSIYTWRNWPYNADGALENASDRNNVVWTGSIDFTGLVGLAADRAGSRAGLTYWEPPSIFSSLPARTYAALVTRNAPAVRWRPALQEALIEDILGESDGVPGLLDPESVVVMDSPSGAMPADILKMPVNATRRRTPADFLPDGAARAGTLAVFGTRIRTPPSIVNDPAVADVIARYGLRADEFFTNVVSLMLDWQPPPPNLSPLIDRWDRVEAGWRVFREERCDTCHAGPFFTDNRVNRESRFEREEFGLSPPSTAGWMVPGRDLGPPIGTDVHRTIGTRLEEIFLSPTFDPNSGRATRAVGQLSAFFRDQRVGYKTLTLRNVWATAPYLHDGSVGVAFPTSVSPPTELSERLRAAATDPRVMFGMGPILTAFERQQFGSVVEDWHRPDPALSLQALLLESERRKIVASNRQLIIDVPPGAPAIAGDATAPPEKVPMTSVGVSGVGHEFWVNDVPGGERITALVAFLLALDDRPCELPSGSPHCFK